MLSIYFYKEKSVFIIIIKNLPINSINFTLWSVKYKRIFNWLNKSALFNVIRSKMGMENFQNQLLELICGYLKASNQIRVNINSVAEFTLITLWSDWNATHICFPQNHLYFCKTLPDIHEHWYAEGNAWGKVKYIHLVLIIINLKRFSYLK